MMRPAVLASLLCALALRAADVSADQCMWMPTSQAVRAAGQLYPGRLYFTLCEPCGEQVPSMANMPNLRRVGRATVASNPDNSMRVVLDGQDIDAAYVFVRVPSGSYFNLAALVGCQTQGVSRVVSLGAMKP